MALPVVRLLIAVAVALFAAADGRLRAEEPPREGLLLWLDASDLDADGKPDDGPSGAIDRWRDKSGRRNDLEQTDVKRRPTRAVSIGRRPTARFDGDDWLGLRQLRGLSPGDSPLHVVFVMKAAMHADRPNPRLLDIIPAGAEVMKPATVKQRGFWFGYQANGVNRIGTHNGAEGSAGTVAWDDRPHLLEAIYAGDQHYRHRLDAQPDSDGEFRTNPFLGFAEEMHLALGNHYGFPQPNTRYRGDLSEVLIYDRELSLFESSQLHRYLVGKYRLNIRVAPIPHFERDIRALLAKHCHRCHGKDATEAGVDLTSLNAILRGGKGGPIVVRGRPKQSVILRMIEEGKMPPEGEPRLPDDEFDLLKRWIAGGMPADEKLAMSDDHHVTPEARRFWSFQKPVRRPSPAVSQRNRARASIDAFLLHRLERAKLSYSPDAPRRTLIRRLSIDLLGIPPSPKEVSEFLADESPDAYQRLVDRLLASPHFGERWARHWLDWSGYADVYGSDNDAAIIKPLEGKWRYRDYVIRAFNSDKPFDRFLVEQLAGDELADWRGAERFSAEDRDRLIATGFLLTAADDTDQTELNTPDIRHHVLQSTGEVVASNLFALTIQCAKCHDHKYESISQRDYYRWQALFAAAFNPTRWVQSNRRGVPDVPPKERARIDQRNAELQAQLQRLNAERTALRLRYSQRLRKEKLERLPPALRSDVDVALTTPEKKRNGIQKYLAGKFSKTLAVSVAEIERRLSDADRRRMQTLTAEIGQRESERQVHSIIQVVREDSPPAATHILRRGNHLQPGLPVRPGLVALLREEHPTTTMAPPRGPTSGRRLAMARRVTAADSIAGGLVARVYVNRVWQQLFGRGIVATSDNFGVSGARPTHPELLDWLARDFVDSGWRTKRLIRALVLSSAYRQASGRVDDKQKRPLTVDPANDLLWKMRLRRLDSEIIRDAMLTASGRLNRRLHGPPLPLEVRPDGKVVVQTAKLPNPADQWRRGVYVLARRNYHLSMLNTFDQPVISSNCTLRKPSSVVTQSLTLLHDGFVIDAAEGLASRAMREANSAGGAGAVNRAFQIAFSRAPDAEELRDSLELLKRQRARFGGDSQQALAQLCHMLLNANEFLYLD